MRLYFWDTPPGMFNFISALTRRQKAHIFLLLDLSLIPAALGFTAEGRRDGLCICFGWNARESHLASIARTGRI